MWTKVHVHISPEESERRVRLQAKPGAAPPGAGRRSVSRTVEQD